MSAFRKIARDEDLRSDADHLVDCPGSQPEFVELGSHFRLVDRRGNAAARPRPNGLLPVPTEVRNVVEGEEARLLNEQGTTPTTEARQQMVDSLTLQYYFDGVDIAYRRSPRGVEILAVGLDEIEVVIKNATPELKEQMILGQG